MITPRTLQLSKGMSYLDLKNYRTCFWRTITWSCHEMGHPRTCAAWPGMGCARLRPANSRPGGRGRTAVFYPAGHGGSFAGGRGRGAGRSPSRSGCWGSAGGTRATPRRRMSCGLLAGEGDKQLSLHLFVL